VENTSPSEIIRRPIAKEVNYDPEYLRLENERLWTRVWQFACREEELKKPGDFVTYDIGEDSFIVTRALSGELKAYYNVCQHRGRRLTEGCGHTASFRCPFHGWQWNLAGKNTHVSDAVDWGDSLPRETIALKAVNVDIWGGFVFINPDPDCEPLMDFLAPAAKILAPFQIETMRYGWRKQIVIGCNWKVGLGAFNEGYHVRITHSQTLRWSDNCSAAQAMGRHGMFGYPEMQDIFGTGSKRLGFTTDDTRQAIADFYVYIKKALGAGISESLCNASQRLPTEVPAGTSPMDTLIELARMAREEDEARGIPWPNISREEYAAAGIDWHIFPNMILLQSQTNCQGYRIRPNGGNPDSCIIEVFHLERYPEGDEPCPKNIRNDDAEDEEFWGEVMLQDFRQLVQTQRGTKSRGFEGAKLNPRQEVAVANFYDCYHKYIDQP